MVSDLGEKRGEGPGNEFVFVVEGELEEFEAFGGEDGFEVGEGVEGALVEREVFFEGEVGDELGEGEEGVGFGIVESFGEKGSLRKRDGFWILFSDGG